MAFARGPDVPRGLELHQALLDLRQGGMAWANAREFRWSQTPSATVDSVMSEALIFVVFPFCMVFAALSDLLSMTIANRVSLLLVGTFAVLAPLTGMDLVSFGWHLAAFVLVLAVTFGLFALGGMGGGDAKLLAATSLWMGMGIPLVGYLVTAAFIGGALTLFILIYRNSGIAVLTSRNPFLRNFSEGTTGIPYGIALGLGGLLTYPQSPMMVWALERLAAG